MAIFGQKLIVLIVLLVAWRSMASLEKPENMLQNLLNSVDQELKNCAPEECELLKKLVKQSTDSGKSEENAREYTKTVQVLLKQRLQRSGESVESRANLIGTERVLSLTMRSLEMKEADSLEKESIREAEGLYRKYPKLAVTNELWGDFQLLVGGGERKAIELYGNCLNLDPNAEGCRRKYEASVKAYSVPRCLQGHVNPTFSVRVEKQKKPILGARDVREMWIERDVGEISIEFTQEGSRRLEEGTQKNIGRVASVVLGDEVVLAPLIKEGISAGRLVLSVPNTKDDGAGLKLLKRFCSHVETPVFDKK